MSDVFEELVQKMSLKCLLILQLLSQLYAIPNKMVQDFEKPQRVCDYCYRDYLYYQCLIKEQRIQWNTKSLLLCKFLGEQKRIIKIQQPLELSEKQNIEKDILNGRSDSHLLNYSIREFVTQCQQGLKIEQIRNSIMRVLELFVANNPTIGYCQGMNLIAIICLCLADEEGAFHIMDQLFSTIVPQRFYSSSSGAYLIGYYAEVYFLQEIIQINKFKDWQILMQFIELQGPSLLLTLMIQVLNISSLLVTWIQMFQIQSFIPIDKALLYTLQTATLKNIDLMVQFILNNITQKQVALGQIMILISSINQKKSQILKLTKLPPYKQILKRIAQIQIKMQYINNINKE
ncbi:unnamed protein product [Paramecium sonneborni]|uniref:Rab-GAP TBC domain-containing protein n=1 Tax=Paramecium sonneborni TaxID=65129 RepID=A0A8S1NTF9_9CILI|nr:unnamed protein product [Paramecium sonneborni]